MSLSKARARLIARLHRRKAREREGAYLAEGVRCVREVAAAGADVRFAVVAPRLRLTDEGAALQDEFANRGIEVVGVEDDELAGLAATESPQGVLAVVEQPRAVIANPRRAVIADAIQDPGNLGTLIRSAAAFGLDAVFALDGCVDPYNPKVVRSSAGTVARLHVRTCDWPQLQEVITAADLPLLATAGDGAARVRPAPDRWALAVGNEARGVRPEILAAAAATVAIPMAADVDSLNAGVAGSILMFALTQGDVDDEE
jgi:TrmH family RNA methyltransferase